VEGRVAVCMKHENYAMVEFQSIYNIEYHQPASVSLSD
jgi:hypothetical protein